MGHQVSVFVGSFQVLGAYMAQHPTAHAFALTAESHVLAMPLDDDLHDALHRAYGTGEWLEGGPLLSTGDMAFAARASTVGPLAYLETNYFGGAGNQAAVVWKEGALVLGPTVMKAAEQSKRAPALWPINAALKLLGVTPHEGEDEFTALGLGFYRSNEDIWSMARRIPR